MRIGLQDYQRLFGRERRGRTLDRGSLPTPLQYLTERGLLCRRRVAQQRTGGARSEVAILEAECGEIACTEML